MRGGESTSLNGAPFSLSESLLSRLLPRLVPPHCITKCQLKLIIIHSTTVLTVGLNNINLHAKIFN